MNCQIKRTHCVFTSAACGLVVAIVFAGSGVLARDAKAEPKKNAAIGPIVEVTKIMPPKATNFRKKPADAQLIKTADEAGKLFGKQGLATLKKQVNFDKQNLIIIAWSGSGGDRITYFVNASFPEQVVFSYKRGRTRDLRRHFKLYAVRKNVKWSVGK